MTTRALDLHHLHLGWPAASADSLQIDRLTLAPGQTLFLRDPGGCGKRTLLSLAAGRWPLVCCWRRPARCRYWGRAGPRWARQREEWVAVAQITAPSALVQP